MEVADLEPEVSRVLSTIKHVVQYNDILPIGGNRQLAAGIAVQCFEARAKSQLAATCVEYSQDWTECAAEPLGFRFHDNSLTFLRGQRRL